MGKTKSYKREISVTNTARASFRALTLEFDKWWTAGSCPISETGDILTFRFDPTYWTMRVTTLIPDQCVELECIKAHHTHIGLPDSILTEWEGTTLRWEINQHMDHTNIAFVHDGLVPSLKCFKICEAGWDYFFVKRLKSYLDHDSSSAGNQSM